MNNIVLTNEMKIRSIAHSGNPYRILKVFEKAARGEDITYVAIGGSITQYVPACAEFGYAALIAKWLMAKFPKVKVNYINAGIGATGSLIGVHRLERDVLKYDPDFVTVDFSVNDNKEVALESYDNLIFNIMNHTTKPAVLCLGMVNQEGGSVQDIHMQVVKHYDIPYISYRDAVWQELLDGNIDWRELSDDSIHPHNGGHKLTADLIINYLDSVDSITALEDNNCSTALVNNVFRYAKMYYVDDIKPKDFGCFGREYVNLNRIPYGWIATENGSPLTFEFKDCHRIYVLFEKSNRGDGGKAIVEVCDKEIELDADFNDCYTYCHDTLIYSSEIQQDVVLTITPDLEEGKHFTVAGIMVS